MKGYSHLKEEALDRNMWRNRFGGGFGPVVRQNTEWMNEVHECRKLRKSMISPSFFGFPPFCYHSTIATPLICYCALICAMALTRQHVMMSDLFRPFEAKCLRSIEVNINFLQPTCYVMHRQFNVQNLYALPTLYLYVFYLSENKQRLVPLTA